MNAKAKRLLSLALSTLMVSSTVSFAIPAAAEPAMGEGSTDSFYSSFENNEEITASLKLNEIEVDKDGTTLAGGLADPSESGAALKGEYVGYCTDITGSKNHNSSEVPSNLIDRSTSTKWLTNANVPSTSSPIWLNMTMKEPVVVRVYSISAANDSPERDPKDWVLKGSNDGQTYEVIDTQSGVTFNNRYQTKQFEIENETAYQYYRLEITANKGNNSMTQFSDIAFGSNEGEDTEEKIVGMSSTTGATAWLGSRGLNISGVQGSANDHGYSYNVLYDNLDIAVGPNTKLSYMIQPKNGSGYDFNYTSLYVAVDLRFTDGTYLSDLAATDQYRYPLNPTGQGQGKALVYDQWNQIYSQIGEVAAGKTIEKILVGYDNPNGAGGSFSASIDDIRIENEEPVVYDRPSDYVYTLRGTNNVSGRYFSRGLTGPATAVPHGFNFWSPNNVSTGDGDVYHYASTGTMNWMRLGHVASVWIGDRGGFFFMPTTNSGSTANYSRDNEVAKAHYYSVEFNKDDGNMSAGAKLELAPTMHGSISRFTFDDGVANRKVKFSNGGYGSVITFNASNNSFTALGSNNIGAGSNGMGQMYVYGVFDTAPASTSSSEVSFGEDVKEVNMRIATSFISYDQAKKNLEQEISAEDSLEDVKERAQTLWDEKLGTIEVEGANFNQLTTLYSNMYRLFLYPNSMGENTGTVEEPKMQYQSPYGNGVQDGDLYYNNGFWDTYRTTWAAYALLTPESNTTLLNGLVEHYQDCGWIPRWVAPGGTDSMVGTSSDVILGDAIMRGQDFNYEDAYASAIKNASVVSSDSTKGRQNTLDSAIFEGYNRRSEGLSWTLEGWINDYGISNMAKTLRDMEEPGTQEWEEYNDEYEYYINSATRYVHLFKDGWFTSVGNMTDPTRWGGDYTETNGWNMAFHAPQDGNGLANLYGGKEGLREKLDALFSTPGTFNTGSYGGEIHEMREAREVKMGQFGMSNQPSHHIPYMYLFTDQPWKTQSTVREVMERLYVGSEIGQGYCGDEDNGEMSAWYILSCLGLYPLSMGSGEFAIGSPLFEKATIHVEGANDIVINAPGNDHDSVYVQSLKVNGEDYNKTYIKQTDLVNDEGKTVTLDFVMGDEPNTSFGTAEDSAPTSITQGNEKPNPKEDFANNVTFVDSADKLAGEGIKAYAQNISNTSSLFDNSTGSSWGSSSAASITADTASLTFFLGAGNKQAVNMYTISSTSDGSISPVSWTLEASNNGTDWVTIDERDNQVFEWGRYTRPFATENETRYSFYRFNFDGNNGKQISEIQFLGIDQGPIYDKVELENALENANTYEGTYYTEDSFKALTDAIAAGETVLANPDATEDDYTVAVNNINKAITNLVDNGRKALEASLEEALDYEGTYYTEDSFKALTDAIAEGQAVLEDEASDKTEFTAANTAIQNAIRGLVDNGIKGLTEAVEKAEGYKYNNYTEDSWQALVDALANGKAILEKEDATKAERDDATKAINDAIAGLTSNGRVELDAALKKARSIGPKFYTEDSFAILTAAIENGQAVYDNPESSKQQCDDATAAIEAAINGLVSNGKRDPFNRIEAEKFDDSYGSVKSESNYGASNGQSVGYVAVGDYLVYNKIDFEDSNGASKITINYANMYDSEVEIRLGSTDGALVATLKLPATGSWTRFEETTIDLDTAIDPEVVDLYMVFTKQSTNVDYFSFTESEEAPLPSEEDLQALKDAIAEAEAYDADNYTEDSYAALTSAVEDGKALLDNAEATKTQVLDATQAIKDAIDALTAKEFVLSASADKDTYEPNETITLTIKTSAD
ncbi:GH92 family glycosyl hydrolase, partial [[Clostridium] leptum]|nr:GH92 family glycosyl hydrolase [[Clostridium] leptum]